MIRWKRSVKKFIKSHCGEWWITPEYWSCVDPQAYTLQRKYPDGTWKKVAFGCATQAEAKKIAEECAEKGTPVVNDSSR